ncbi:hypothetical protein [Alicyclobacillus vulcanalis]|uniref:DUF5667 domain-containing protein n=1 Tax=Alicyclobacillus vulcanalis TaxID=252246 RepID=A0A1N7PFY1_9BACL|nr:hypothetical protein [Alicyclobacillus vulcanalis]SIT09491.1 hypothetical protein SAMN05421799_11332 [Alicyclobacillus vulcanalis]
MKRMTRGVTAIMATGIMLAATSPIALAEPRGLQLGHPTAVARGHQEHISLSLVKSNATIVEALYQQYESLTQNGNSSSALSPAVTQLISELQSDLAALQSASNSTAARETMNHILRQVTTAEAEMRDEKNLTTLEQQIAKEYSQFSQALNQLTSTANPSAGQVLRLWNLENLLIAKLRAAILELGATPTAASSNQGSAGSGTSSAAGSTDTTSSSGNTSTGATSNTASAPSNSTSAS